jgi:MinD-like ATPase involved in chromosome partitioning or flagellar assembly
MKITRLAKKGSVGKSTVSILLYEAFRQAGKSVAIHDWDAQGTSSKSLELILGAKQPGKTDNASIVIYDTPPSLDHTATATAVRSADIVLVVTSPSPADIWEADDAVRFAKAKNPKAEVRVIFNKVRRSTVLGRLVDDSAKQVSVLALPVTLSARECYQHDRGARLEILGWGRAPGSPSVNRRFAITTC